MVGNRLKLLRLSLSVAVMLFGLAVVAAPTGAQTIPPDYTPVQHSDGPPDTPPEVPPGVQPTDVAGDQAVQAAQAAQAAPAVDAEALARTGSDSAIPLGRIGLVLLAGGGFVVLFARRRRQAKAPAG